MYGDVSVFIIVNNPNNKENFAQELAQKLELIINPHLHERVSEHRDQKYFGEVSFWPAEYRNRPPIVPLIFNFKNFGEF